MKKFTLVSLLCLMMFLVTGCQKFSYDIKIDKKGNIAISETDALNMAVIETFAGEESINSKLQETADEIKAEGYDVTIFSDGKFKGLTRQKKKAMTVETLKKEDLPAGFTLMQTKPVVFNKNFLKNSYTIKWNYSLQAVLDINNENSEGPIAKANQDLLLSDSSAMTPEQQMMREVFAETVKPVADLKITIPYRATSHNANKAGKVGKSFVYYWDLSDAMQNETIELIYEKVDYTGSIVALTFILLFIGLFMFFLKIKEESF